MGRRDQAVIDLVVVAVEVHDLARHVERGILDLPGTPMM